MKQDKLIVFLDRQKIILAGNRLKAPLTLDLPPTVIFDLEVIDPEGFNNLVIGWLEQNGIVPTQILIVLSANLYYQSDLAATSDVAARKQDTDRFLSNIPHKNLYSKEYLLPPVLKVIAINKDFYEPYIRFFKKQRFSIIALVPTLVLDSLKLNLVEYTPKEVDSIFKKTKTLTQYSLVSAQEIEKTIISPTVNIEENKPRKLALIAVFLILCTVLVGLLFIRPRLYKPTPTPTLNAKVTPGLQATVLESTPTTASPTAALLAKEVVRVKVVNSSGVPNQAGKIGSALALQGYKNISTGTSAKIVGQKNQIIYSSSVGIDIINQIKISVTSLAGEAAASQSDTLTESDVLITLVSKAQ